MTAPAGPRFRPWITPTDQEQFDGTFGFDGTQLIIGGAQRDEQGVLWQPMVDNPGDGRVLWKDMHTGRQKTAMLEGRCQVCGQLRPERPLTWLIPPPEVQARKPSGRPVTTATPPTCPDCLPKAQQLCPNLRAGSSMLLLVKHWRPVAVFGDMIDRAGRHVKAEVALGSSELSRMMGRHLVVEIYDYRKAR